VTAHKRRPTEISFHWVPLCQVLSCVCCSCGCGCDCDGEIERERFWFRFGASFPEKMLRYGGRPQHWFYHPLERWRWQLCHLRHHSILRHAPSHLFQTQQFLQFHQTTQYLCPSLSFLQFISILFLCLCNFISSSANYYMIIAIIYSIWLFLWFINLLQFQYSYPVPEIVAGAKKLGHAFDAWTHSLFYAYNSSVHLVSVEWAFEFCTRCCSQN